MGELELTKKDYEVIFDILNVYEPEDISHVYPEMATDEFMSQLKVTWRKVLDIVSEPNDVITEKCQIKKNEFKNWLRLQKSLDNTKQN